MPRSCIIPGCPTKQTGGYSMFKLPNSPGVFYQEWKQRIIEVLKRYKDMEGAIWEQKIRKGMIFTCERHYTPEDFERTGTLIFSSEQRAQLNLTKNNPSLRNHQVLQRCGCLLTFFVEFCSLRRFHDILRKPYLAFLAFKTHLKK